MADLLDRVRSDLDARLRELRPIAFECERLERAAAALERPGVGLLAEPSPAAATPPSAPRAARRVAGKRAAPASAISAKAGNEAQPRGGRAPRGQTRAKLLQALTAAPGSSTAALAQAAGTSPSIAGATISRLVKQGRVRRLDQGGYTVVETASDNPPEAPPATPTSDGAPPNPGEAPGEPPSPGEAE